MLNKTKRYQGTLWPTRYYGSEITVYVIKNI